MGEPALPSPPPADASGGRRAESAGISLRGAGMCSWPWPKPCRRGSAWTAPGEWARNWCASSRPLPEERNSRARPGTQRRWTTSLADQLDRKVVDLATEARFAHLPAVMPALADRRAGRPRHAGGRGFLRNTPRLRWGRRRPRAKSPVAGAGGVHRRRPGGVAGGGHDRAVGLSVRAVGQALAGAHFTADRRQRRHRV